MSRVGVQWGWRDSEGFEGGSLSLVGRFATRWCWLHALMFLQQLLQRCSIFWRWGHRESHQEPPGVAEPSLAIGGPLTPSQGAPDLSSL